MVGGVPVGAYPVASNLNDTTPPAAPVGGQLVAGVG